MIYKYIYLSEHGYLVYRDIAPKCESIIEKALAHKIAEFSFEEDAADYCDYRNKEMDRYGSDDLFAKDRPIGELLMPLFELEMANVNR